jgi:uncharacterized membrane protein
LAPQDNPLRVRPSWPWWRLTLTGLSALALALSAYLSWHYLAGGSVIGCSGGSPCDQVLSSKWSSIGGVLPVAGLAAGAYLAMLVASFFIGPGTATSDRRLAWGAMLILVGSAAGSAVWFTIVQKWFINAFCPYCMATHITGLILAALVTWRAPRQFVDDSVTVPSPNPPRSSPESKTTKGVPRRLVLVGLALAGLMAACQFVFAPRGAFRSGEVAATSNAPPIVPRAVPLAGSPDAPYIVTLFFDYQCSHCQKLHSLLEEVIGRYNGKLAFVLCPAPLSPQCNPYIARDTEQFKDSCELVKISLAVWVAKREAFSAFDQWMFAPDAGQFWRPRSLDAARAKAIELIGQPAFDTARADPWIDRYLQNSVRMFGDTILGGNAVPKMVFGSRWVIPEPEDADEFMTILRSSLAMPAPATRPSTARK